MRWLLIKRAAGNSPRSSADRPDSAGPKYSTRPGLGRPGSPASTRTRMPPTGTLCLTWHDPGLATGQYRTRQIRDPVATVRPPPVVLALRDQGPSEGNVLDVACLVAY